MIIRFQVYRDADFWCARGIGESIFTQGKTYRKFLANLQEAALLHFDDTLQPSEDLKLLLQRAKS